MHDERRGRSRGPFLQIRLRGGRTASKSICGRRGGRCARPVRAQDFQCLSVRKSAAFGVRPGMSVALRAASCCRVTPPSGPPPPPVMSPPHRSSCRCLPNAPRLPSTPVRPAITIPTLLLLPPTTALRYMDVPAHFAAAHQSRAGRLAHAPFGLGSSMSMSSAFGTAALVAAPAATALDRAAFCGTTSLPES